MLLLRLWNYIRGYVIIVVEGYFLEKFINICIHRQIFLWDINRQKNCTMTLKISIKGFRMLRPVAKKTNCRVKIIRKKGLPFLLNRYRNRKTFIVGAFVFVVSFYLLTSFVWAIEIEGNTKVDSSIIIGKLAEYGAKPGVLKYRINTGDIVNNMMLNMKELAWIGVSVKGTKIKVRIEERVKPPSLIPKNEPCNIVAYRDGVIKSVHAKNGQQEVKAGDTVVKGQVLISGIITSENKEIQPRQVHAIGQVLARTWYEKKVSVDMKLQEKVRTGNQKNNYTLVLFSKPIKLFHKKAVFENYDKVEINKRVSLGEDMVLPFGLVIDRYYENNIIERKISLDEAKKIAMERAMKEISGEMPEDVKIEKKDVEYVETEDGELEANLIVECLEDIGVTERLGETN